MANALYYGVKAVLKPLPPALSAEPYVDPARLDLMISCRAQYRDMTPVAKMRSAKSVEPLLNVHEPYIDPAKLAKKISCRSEDGSSKSLKNSSRSLKGDNGDPARSQGRMTGRSSSVRVPVPTSPRRKGTRPKEEPAAPPVEPRGRAEQLVLVAETIPESQPSARVDSGSSEKHEKGLADDSNSQVDCDEYPKVRPISGQSAVPESSSDTRSAHELERNEIPASSTRQPDNGPESQVPEIIHGGDSMATTDCPIFALDDAASARSSGRSQSSKLALSLTTDIKDASKCDDYRPKDYAWLVNGIVDDRAVVRRRREMLKLDIGADPQLVEEWLALLQVTVPTSPDAEMVAPGDVVDETERPQEQPFTMDALERALAQDNHGEPHHGQQVSTQLSKRDRAIKSARVSLGKVGKTIGSYGGKYFGKRRNDGKAGSTGMATVLTPSSPSRFAQQGRRDSYQIPSRDSAQLPNHNDKDADVASYVPSETPLSAPKSPDKSAVNIEFQSDKKLSLLNSARRLTYDGLDKTKQVTKRLIQGSPVPVESVLQTGESTLMPLTTPPLSSPVRMDIRNRVNMGNFAGGSQQSMGVYSATGCRASGAELRGSDDSCPGKVPPAGGVAKTMAVSYTRLVRVQCPVNLKLDGLKVIETTEACPAIEAGDQIIEVSALKLKFCSVRTARCGSGNSVPH